MEILLLLFLIVILAIAARKALRYKTLSPLLPRKYNFGKRRDTLRTTLGLLEDRGARTLVETGVARHGLAKCKGDGASTIVFGLWASQHRAHLYSVDIDPEATATAQQVIDGMDLQDSISVNTSDSVQYLREFSEPVDFLYLDSYDYDKRDVEIQLASQQHHLDEFTAIENLLHDKSVVLIDDCNLPGGGKGKLVIDYMTSHGWKVHQLDYQAILVRGQPD